LYNFIYTVSSVFIRPLKAKAAGAFTPTAVTVKLYNPLTKLLHQTLKRVFQSAAQQTSYDTDHCTGCYAAKPEHQYIPCHRYGVKHEHCNQYLP